MSHADNPGFVYAKLSRQDNPFFRGNVLIEALPDYDSCSSLDILKELNRKNPKSSKDMKSIEARTSFLQICLRNVFIPTHRHIALMRTVDDLLRYGYFSQRGRHVIEVKSDTGADGATIQCLSESELYVERGVQKYPEYRDHSDEAFCSTTPSVCLIGWSGIGKTSSINHVIQLYPQVILHRKSILNDEFTQLVWLKVECPSKTRPKAVCSAILGAIDEALGTSYKSKITQPMSQERARAITTDALKSYFVGVLIIDEIQNISDQRNNETFFNFIVELTNTVKASLIFIGTPKVKKFLDKDFRILRRFASLGSMQWQPLSRNKINGGQSEWQAFLSRLEEYNLTGSAMSNETTDALFDYSQGITDLLVKLFFITQIECITRSVAFDAASIKKTFNLHFKDLEPVIKAIRNSDFDFLDKYSDLAVPYDVLDSHIDNLLKDYHEAVDQESKRTVDEAVDFELLSGAEEMASGLIDLVIRLGLNLSAEQKALVVQNVVRELRDNGDITMNKVHDIATGIIKSYRQNK